MCWVAFIPPTAKLMSGLSLHFCKLTFFNGEKYRYLWVQEALNQIQIGQYAGTAASLDITAVSAIADIEVDNATVIGDVPLPEKV